LNQDESEAEEERIPDFRATFECVESRAEKLQGKKHTFQYVESPDEM
jgi:hypothetical protein